MRKLNVWWLFVCTKNSADGRPVPKIQFERPNCVCEREHTYGGAYRFEYTAAVVAVPAGYTTCVNESCIHTAATVTVEIFCRYHCVSISSFYRVQQFTYAQQRTKKKSPFALLWMKKKNIKLSIFLFIYFFRSFPLSTFRFCHRIRVDYEHGAAHRTMQTM